MRDVGPAFTYEGAELVIGLVAPVGTDFERFEDALGVALGKFEYRANRIRLSDLAVSFYEENTEIEGTEEYARLTHRMNAGNAARQHGGDLLALAAAAKIHGARRGEGAQKEPLRKTAHVLRSLKHPSEVQTLRRIYGPGFFLVGIISSDEERRNHLTAYKGCDTAEVDKLFLRDDHEGNELGQRTRDTFHLADVFLGLNDVTSLNRFLGLVFGNPYETPSRDEYAMFLAFSAALRSADLSRQVGAVLTTGAGDVVAIGTNDVPVAGGGLCWPGPQDHRDHKLGRDTNEMQRRKMVQEILAALRPDGVSAQDWERAAMGKLANAAVMDITEYGRAVHAEMEALLSCARSGVSPRGSTLFSTTFPCHNCAKHIIAAGVTRVVYVEPYPKSQASQLYPASISLGKTASGEPQVVFEPFTGIGPRRFFDLFSIGLSSGYPVKRKQDGKTREWSPGAAAVRVPLLPNSYITREATAAEKLELVTGDEDPKK